MIITYRSGGVGLIAVISQDFIIGLIQENELIAFVTDLYVTSKELERSHDEGRWQVEAEMIHIRQHFHYELFISDFELVGRNIQ